MNKFKNFIDNSLPSPYAALLVNTLTEYSKINRYYKHNRLYMHVGDMDYCYILIEGSITIHRLDDDRVIGTALAPSLYGFSHLVKQNYYIYFKTIGHPLIGKLPLKLAEQILNKHNLWEPLAKHLLITMGKFYQIDYHLTANSAYEIVCHQLNELMKENTDIKLSLTAENYIRSKSNLSRSRVMKVLSDLKKGGYIETNKGRLVNINKLPSQY